MTKLEEGNVWVRERDNIYTVFVTGITHSESDSAYDSKDLALARAAYLANIKSPYRKGEKS